LERLGRGSTRTYVREIPADVIKEISVIILWILVALLLLLAIGGGVAVSKFLFLVLIVAAVVALIGFFARTA
jgi:hypothetical protein